MEAHTGHVGQQVEGQLRSRPALDREDPGQARPGSERLVVLLQLVDELIVRDKVSLVISRLRDDSLEDVDNMPRRRSSRGRSSKT